MLLRLMTLEQNMGRVIISLLDSVAAPVVGSPVRELFSLITFFPHSFYLLMRSLSCGRTGQGNHSDSPHVNSAQPAAYL